MDGVDDYRSCRPTPFPLKALCADIRRITRVPHAGERKGNLYSLSGVNHTSINFNLQNSINGVIWYILGVNFVLSLYPQDIATIAILMCVLSFVCLLACCAFIIHILAYLLTPCSLSSLSWADTAASTFGRMYGAVTPKLPTRLPILGLPLAPRKSLAGFAAAVITGACITFGFWTWIGPLRPDAPTTLSWTWEEGITLGAKATTGSTSWTAGALGLIAISLVAGLVSGVAEALGECCSFISRLIDEFYLEIVLIDMLVFP